MTRIILIFFMVLYSVGSVAEKPVGFLWYNVEKEKKESVPKPKGIPFNRLSYTERDSVLQFYTMEALHRARQTKSVKDMRVFLSLQDYWLKESTRFRDLFQKTMLLHPEYDYTVTHPTSNLGTKLTDEVREAYRKSVIKKLSKTHGLLFFYRGKSPYDLKQIPIITDFCKRFKLDLIPVSVDGIQSYQLPSSRLDKGQANALGVRFFPALLLVNPKNHQSMPVAFGLTTQDLLEKRLVQVATQFKGDV
jgi:conjugal transfer pilus assembly protein TraF